MHDILVINPDSSSCSTLPSENALYPFSFDFFPNEQALSTSASKPLPEIEISRKPQELDAVFSLFLICFFLLTMAFSNQGKQMLGLMFNNLIRLKSRQSIFFETTSHELKSRFLLLSLSVLLSSAVGYYFFFEVHLEGFPDFLGSLAAISLFFILILLYLLYKWVGYKVISYAFFNKRCYDQWFESWMALISLHALLLFVPALLLFYVPELLQVNVVLLFLCFFIIRVAVIYKSYMIFFNNLTRLHYFFLYLCAQEIIPLFLLYKGMSRIFNMLETSIL